VASVEKRLGDDGKVAGWTARWRDETNRQRKRTFRRKTDADRFAAIVETDKLRGTYVDPSAGRVTFAAYFAEWSKRQLWESTTVTAMNLAVRSTTFVDVPMGKIRRSHVEQWVKVMASDLAPGSVKTRFNNVRSVFRASVRDRVLATDPSEGVTLPRDRRREAAMVLPTDEQVARILDAADDRFRAFVALAAFAGLRLGEAAAVQVSDVNFLGRSLDVRRQVQRAGGGRVEIRPPKYGSERSVYLADGLLEMLAQHIAEHRAGDDPQRWLFQATMGQPPHQNTIGYLWRKACRKAGVDGFTLHDLRHCSPAA
jgi:integrase